LDLRRLFGDVRDHWMVGIAVALFAVLVGIGVAVGHSSSKPGAGPTGASGPSGRSEKRRLDHRKLADRSPRQRKPVTVPNVVGDQKQAAIDELAASHLRGRFGSSPASLVCAGPAPDATVVRQFPTAGAKAPVNKPVDLLPSAMEQTGCGHPGSLAECDPQDLALTMSQSRPDYTGGGEDRLINVDVTNAHAKSQCAVNSTLTISIGPSGGGVLSSIAANPATLQLHAALARGDQVNAGWVIGSWCGSRHGMVATASLSGLQARRSLTELPFGGGCPAITIYSLYRHQKRQSRS
jgi:hypothetical protein